MIDLMILGTVRLFFICLFVGLTVISWSMMAGSFVEILTLKNKIISAGNSERGAKLNRRLKKERVLIIAYSLVFIFGFICIYYLSVNPSPVPESFLGSLLYKS